MLRNQAEGIFLNLMSLVIYGSQKKVSDQTREIAKKGKKGYSKGVETYLPEYVFLNPIPNYRLNQNKAILRVWAGLMDYQLSFITLTETSILRFVN